MNTYVETKVGKWRNVVDERSPRGAYWDRMCKQVDGGPPEENWESVTLTLKRNNYELRRNATTRRVVASDKYSSDVAVRLALPMHSK